jgi:hypothetical protein
MKTAVWIVSGLAAGLTWTRTEDPHLCDHGIRGAARAIRIEELEKSYRHFARTLEQHLTSPHRLQMEKDRRYDSGLPSCRIRNRRRVKPETPLPAEWVGRHILVAPESHPDGPRADIHLVTHSDRFGGLAGRTNILLADPALLLRLEIRCQVSRIDVIRVNEVELVEGG